ncbi:hypothetical protein [Flammeovirga pacifica]|uniref:hypothetical protein n=1 Tax=Flammeovirga pacifica TaxID=915059 RepID=UPI0013011AFF|nr:hypothetical protein [Flammeovirga pacifica]
MNTIFVIVLFMFVTLIGLFSLVTQSKHNLNALGIVAAVIFVSVILAQVCVQFG